jgi:hypothetical protein
LSPEQPLARAEHDRKDPQLQLVDEVVFDQPPTISATLTRSRSATAMFPV